MTRIEIRDRLLNDEEFMAGLQHSVEEYIQGGRKSTPWSEVARDLAIKRTSGSDGTGWTTTSGTA